MFGNRIIQLMEPPYALRQALNLEQVEVKEYVCGPVKGFQRKAA